MANDSNLADLGTRLISPATFARSIDLNNDWVFNQTLGRACEFRLIFNLA